MENEGRHQFAGTNRTFGEWLKVHAALASVLVLICSLTPRLFLTTRAEPMDLLRPDSYTFITPALSLLEHGAFLNSHKEPEVSRTPGYPAFMAALMMLVGKDIVGEDLGKFVIVQTTIVSWSVVFLYWLGCRILPPVMAFTGSLLAAFSPWNAVLAGVPMADGLFMLLLAATFLAIKLVEDSRELTHALWGSAMVGLLTSAAVLTRPFQGLVILMGGGLLLRYGPGRKGACLVFTIMMLTAITPLYLWQVRNIHEAQFNGLTDLPGRAVWEYLASRVKQELTGENRFDIQRAIMLEEDTWDLSVQEADQERWRRAKAVFLEHPALTVYCFLRSALEHMVHPSPNILTSARLNFRGDYWALGLLWGVFVSLAFIGWRGIGKVEAGLGSIDRGWLAMLLVVCLLITLASGIAYGAGSRFRASLELIVPLLAGVGVIRIICSFKGTRVPLDSTIGRPGAIKPR